MKPAEKIGPILELLAKHYPEAHCTLDFKNPLELVVATVLGGGPGNTPADPALQAAQEVAWHS